MTAPSPPTTDGASDADHMAFVEAVDRLPRGARPDLDAPYDAAIKALRRPGGPLDPGPEYHRLKAITEELSKCR